MYNKKEGLFMKVKDVLSVFSMLFFFLFLTLVANFQFSDYGIIKNILLIIETLSVFSWQIVTLIALYYFKDPIIDLLRKIKSIGYNGAILELNQELEGTINNLSEITEQKGISTTTSIFDLNDYDGIGEVVISWETLNKEIFEILKNHRIIPNNYSDNQVKSNYSYYVSEYLKKSQSNVFAEYAILRKIRNQIVHQNIEENLRDFEVQEYSKACKNIYLIIKNQIEEKY